VCNSIRIFTNRTCGSVGPSYRVRSSDLTQLLMGVERFLITTRPQSQYLNEYDEGLDNLPLLIEAHNDVAAAPAVLLPTINVGTHELTPPYEPDNIPKSLGGIGMGFGNREAHSAQISSGFVTDCFVPSGMAMPQDDANCTHRQHIDAGNHNRFKRDTALLKVSTKSVEGRRSNAGESLS
jgi:hypothetical protein